jgi:RNA polymerase primary sigma factor
METTVEDKCSSADSGRSLAGRHRATSEDRGGHRSAIMLAGDRRTGTAKRSLANRAGETAHGAKSLPQLARTFDVPEVEEEFISFCQLTAHTPRPCAADEAEAQRLELMRQLGRRVYLPEFDLPDATRRICGSTLLEPRETASEVETWLDTRSIYARLCATRLLSVLEEHSVLRRMHYFKHLARQILARDELSEWDWVRVQGLIKAATWHRDLMVQANMRLIVSIVKRLPIKADWYDELISDGGVALLRAVEKFDPGRGYRFCTYATTVIRRECYSHVKCRRLDQGKYTPSAVLPAQAARSGRVSITADGDSDREHWIAWRDRLAGLMGTLSRREQVVIRSRYGLGSHRRVKTLKRLSAALKISKERVRQIEISALAKLRAAAADLQV